MYIFSSSKEKTFIGFPRRENTACVSGFLEDKMDAEADSPSVTKIDDASPYRERSL
ncbi:hypothetical protein B711_0034 [Chlamydia psittaci CP3]|nr:hypothetical protein B711_0034 [Chlamydia psittaci CP3]